MFCLIYIDHHYTCQIAIGYRFFKAAGHGDAACVLNPVEEKEWRREWHDKDAILVVVDESSGHSGYK